MKNYSSRIKTDLVLVFIFFLLIFALGCMVFDDYGMSWDENAQRRTGLVNFKYVVSIFSDSAVNKLDPNNQIEIIDKYDGRYYGVVLQTPLILMELTLNKYFSKPMIWKLKHLMTFLYFFIGVLLFYKFISSFFESRLYGILAVLLIFLTPRFFAESFYNIKDIAFFASYLAAFYFFYEFLTTRSVKYIVLLSLFAALSSAVRILGLLFVLLAGCVVLIEMLQKKENLKHGIRNILLLGCSFAFFLILFYPASWHNPFVYFFELVKYMGNHPWNSKLLYMGGFVSGHAIPWHYIPVWIAITTPVPIFIFFIYGLYKTTRQSIIDIWHKQISNTTYMYLGALFIIFFPVVVAIAGNSTLYNGWRQFYFIYSAMLIVTMVGIQSFYKTFIKEEKTLRIVGVLLFNVCVIYALYTAAWMVKNHPFQNVYFTFLAGKTPYALFEGDYWGLSIRRGLEYVTSKDNRGQILMLCFIPENNVIIDPIKSTIDMIDEKDSQRITCTFNPAEANYIINFLGRTAEQYTDNDEVYSVKVDNFKIMNVIKLW